MSGLTDGTHAHVSPLRISVSSKMADQQQDSQSWDVDLDTNFDFQSNDTGNGPHSATSAASSAPSGSGSPPDYHFVNGTAPPAPDNLPITSTGPDPGFADFTADAAWVDPNQFTPPLGPNDGESLDTLNLFPDNWNLQNNPFPNQNLQFRPRADGLPQAQPVDLFNGLFNGNGSNPSSGDHSSRLAPAAATMPTLTPAQQEQLRNIAMPPHLQYQSPKSELSQGSPQSSSGEGKAGSPDPSKPGSRKRKSSADEDDMDDEDDEDHPIKKTAHNMIEKRYRTNLNDKIAALRDSVPSLRVLSKSARGEDTTEDREELHGLTPAHKLNKATVSYSVGCREDPLTLIRGRF